VGGHKKKIEKKKKKIDKQMVWKTREYRKPKIKKERHNRKDDYRRWKESLRVKREMLDMDGP
jgi:hypothetical protein